jgi:hypothetical protein
LYAANDYLCREQPIDNNVILADIGMRKTYLRPGARAVDIDFDSSFLQSGGSGYGTGQGSDMDAPDDTQNPF